MTECYMLVLQGMGDTEVKLVNKETWDWINNLDVDPPQKQIDHFIENEYCHERPTKEEAIENLRSLNSSTTLNDRALKAHEDYGYPFFHIKEALDFVSSNCYEIVDTFEGGIY